MAAASNTMPKSSAEDVPIPKPTSSKKIDFDPDGDLTLRIGQGTKAVEYLVCSRAVSRTSPVFKVMLHGPFIEARPNDGSAWVVNFPQDDPNAAKVVFNIVHSRFKLLDKPATIQELYDILVFTNKYNMTAIIKPWASAWFPDESTFKSDRNFPALVGIACELGAQDELKRVAKRIVAGCRVNEKGNIVEVGGKIIENMPLMPPGLLDHLAHKRGQLLDRFSLSIRDVLKDLSALVRGHGRQSYCGDPLGTTAAKKRLCDTVTLGSIDGWLYEEEKDKSGLWMPGNTTKGYMPSLSTLIGRLNNIQYGNAEGLGHRSCPILNPTRTVATELRSLLNNMSIHLPMETEIYLQKQTDKVGAIKAGTL